MARQAQELLLGAEATDEAIRTLEQGEQGGQGLGAADVSASAAAGAVPAVPAVPATGEAVAACGAPQLGLAGLNVSAAEQQESQDVHHAFEQLLEASSDLDLAFDAHEVRELLNILLHTVT